MINVHLKSPEKELKFQHSGGPLEFGRGPQRKVPRKIIPDPCVSGDHLLVEELPGGRLRVENLSKRVPVEVEGTVPLGLRETRVVKLPIHMRLGQTDLQISAVSAPAATHSDDLTRTLDPAASGSIDLPSLGGAPDPETLAQWFETVICVQQAATSSSEFYVETARAIVDLVGLDRGMVLLRKGQDWEVAAHYTSEPRVLTKTGPDPLPEFSHRVLDEVLKTNRTYFQTRGTAPVTASLTNVEAVVASPIFDSGRNVVGAVYGSRTHEFGAIESDARDSGISPLEAQITQVLAAAVGAGLERVRHQADALRSQMQFEQFFSSKLAAELAKDKDLLEGRQREVTMVFTDVRDFSLISEQLGPSETFHMMQDVMDLQTSIVRDYDGVVVDYVGDGMLAMWNAPTDQPDHAKLACKSVLAIMRQLPALNEKWSPSLNRQLKLGAGINTGIALVGNTGSRVKFKYGPMGPAVNLASRVETASKQLGVDILLTESTHNQLDDSFACRRLCTATLSGVAVPVDLFELRTEENSPDWQRRQKAFETALECFNAKRWADACLAIYPLISDAHGVYDVASLHLLSRAVECMKTNPDPFDPIVHLQSK